VPNEERSDTEILLATYQLERADQQTSANVLVAAAGAGLAYVSAAVFFLAQLEVTKVTYGAIYLTAPIPIFVLTALIVFYAGTSTVRNRYLLFLEASLSPRRQLGVVSPTSSALVKPCSHQPIVARYVLRNSY
jgi:hypothetical protein